MDSPAGPVNILLVEDNLADVRLTREAFKEMNIPFSLEVVRDGEDAMNFLFKRHPYEDKSVPDLILLDLNLPRKDGREVLADLKADKTLRRIPVLILSSSQAEEDIVRTYDLHANSFITKPTDFHQFRGVIKSIEDFWFTKVKLPPTSD